MTTIEEDGHIFTNKFLYKPQEKKAWWGDGEWIDEPDIVQFIHKEILCKIVRQVVSERFPEEEPFGGFLCGYIQIPYDSYHLLKENKEINVHGGLTWSGKYSQKDDTQDYWIGFDCSHLIDIVPSLGEHYEKLHNDCINKYGISIFSSVFCKTYKNINFCVQECISMAEQFLNIKNSKERI